MYTLNKHLLSTYYVPVCTWDILAHDADKDPRPCRAKVTSASSPLCVSLGLHWCALSGEHRPPGVSPREAEPCRAFRRPLPTGPGPGAPSRFSDRATPGNAHRNSRTRQEVKGTGALHLQPVRWQYWCQPDRRAMRNPWTWCPFCVPFCFWAENDREILLQRKAQKTPRSLSTALALQQILRVFTKGGGCPPKSRLRCLSWVTVQLGSTRPTVYFFSFFTVCCGS